MQLWMPVCFAGGIGLACGVILALTPSTGSREVTIARLGAAFTLLFFATWLSALSEYMRAGLLP